MHSQRNYWFQFNIHALKNVISRFGIRTECIECYVKILENLQKSTLSASVSLKKRNFAKFNLNNIHSILVTRLFSSFSCVLETFGTKKNCERSFPYHKTALVGLLKVPLCFRRLSIVQFLFDGRWCGTRLRFFFTVFLEFSP